MRSMPELLLIDEAAERALTRVHTMLTLVQLSFDTGEALARRLAAETGAIIDPEATCLFGEARRLLLCPAPDLFRAQAALWMAATREPHCYGRTYVALCELLSAGLREAADAELATDELERESKPLRS